MAKPTKEDEKIARLVKEMTEILEKHAYNPFDNIKFHSFGLNIEIKIMPGGEYSCDIKRDRYNHLELGFNKKIKERFEKNNKKR